ncbi:molecular chaperone [Thalassolituus sp.]|uniref:molecular chaperone n=1 Tax=Thalassolituus sp. TaxID=2030822 RepID=UPI002A81E005|nr:molecular chaperone [Thalassolituus sp.]
MICGFDYGTSNCAVGVINSKLDVRLLTLDQGKAFMPSALYALERELICEAVANNISSPELQQQFIDLRVNPLAQARRVRREHDIAGNEEILFVGSEAFEQYFSFPEEGYFVKSPKSFLGASGLRSEFIHFFEDIVTAMMQTVKRRAETELGQELTHTVIGKPVNFQGMNAEKSNQQALDILRVAAQRSGFQQIEFLFEPIAAGLNFEQSLATNRTVLVVDVGGGTTDCAMVRMGPDHRDQDIRDNDFIGHSGERIGGNDLDIQIAGKQLMPLFGMTAPLKTGKPMPMQTFWNAVSTNDVGALATFNSLDTALYLDQLQRDCAQPELIKRFIKMREDKQNHHLVRSAEQSKIALSDVSEYELDLAYIEAGLGIRLTRTDLAQAIAWPLEKMTNLMSEAINQAGTQPDVIYITGGSAKSPAIRHAVEQKLGNIPVLDGDHFGSVAAGLTVWANRLFR